MEKVLEVYGVTKKSNNETILDVTFQMNRGLICSLLGVHNSGKTLLLNIITQSVLKNSGVIKLFGSTDFAMESRRLGYIPQKFSGLEYMTVWNNLKYFSLAKGDNDEKKINELCVNLSLSGLKKRKVQKLSFGEKKRLALAVSLLSKPDFIIWDAPFDDLDSKEINFIKSLVKKLNIERKISFLLAGKECKNFTDFADEFMIIHSGQMIGQYTTEQLTKKSYQYIKIQTAEIEKVSRIFYENNFNFEVANQQCINLFQKTDCISEIIELLISGQIKLDGIEKVGKEESQILMELMKGK